MIVGSFGNVSFEVSNDTIKTFQSMKLDRAASYAQHKVHGMKAVPEFTGFDCAQITFEVTLSIFFGIPPRTELQKLEDMLKSRKGYPLALGTDLYGGKWLLTKIGSSFKHFWKDGTLMTVSTTLTLLEMEE